MTKRPLLLALVLLGIAAVGIGSIIYFIKPTTPDVIKQPETVTISGVIKDVWFSDGYVVVKFEDGRIVRGPIPKDGVCEFKMGQRTTVTFEPGGTVHTSEAK